MVRIFWSFTRQAFMNTSAYRFEFWIQILQVFLVMYGILWVWNKIYFQMPNAFDISFEQMITYGILGMIFDTVYFHMDGPNVYITNQVRSGGIDTDLLKPVNFHFYIFAHVFGETIFRIFTLVLPSYIVAYFFLNLSLPNDFVTTFYFLLSAFLSFLLNFSLNFLLGLLAFVTLNLSGIEWSYYALMRFLGGQLVPLWLFPQFISFFGNLLPFKGIYYIPISIYIGKISGHEIINSILFQLFWLILLVLLGILSWNKVHKKLVVQGG